MHVREDYLMHPFDQYKQVNCTKYINSYCNQVFGKHNSPLGEEDMYNFSEPDKDYKNMF